MISNLGADVLEHCSDQGAFLKITKYDPPHKLLKNRECLSVGCFVAQPLMLEQEWQNPRAIPYKEPIVALSFIQGLFRPKKAEFRMSPAYVVITKHALERIYERLELTYDEFSNVIEGGFRDLVENIAIARAAGLSTEPDDGSSVQSYTVVPYGRGLMILSVRVLVASRDDAEAGFATIFPEDKMVPRPINAAHEIAIDPGDGSAAHDLVGIRVDCCRTFIDMQMFSSVQSSYFHEFEALKAELTDLDRENLIFDLFEAASTLGRLSQDLSHRIERLSTLVHGGWIKVDTEVPACTFSGYVP